MSVTIIECNSKQDTNKSIESSWTNVFQKPIEIGTGDSLQIRNTFINTIAGASGNIIIDNDIECVLEMGYYVIFSDDIKSDVEWNGTALDPEYLPWIARKSNAEPFLKELKSTISSVSMLMLKPSSKPEINVICPIESHSGISLYFKFSLKFLASIERDLINISWYFFLLLM